MLSPENFIPPNNFAGGPANPIGVAMQALGTPFQSLKFLQGIARQHKENVMADEKRAGASEREGERERERGRNEGGTVGRRRTW